MKPTKEMKEKMNPVKEALEAGHRKFVSDEGVVKEVLRFGSNWVRFRTPNMTAAFLTVSMFLFCVNIKEVYTEKSPDSASGQ